MINLPRGPSISRVFEGSILVSTLFRRTGGSRSRRLTSAGSDRGSEPTRDAHLDELEKDSDEEDMAGTRKSGNEIIGLCNPLKRNALLLVAAISGLSYIPITTGSSREVKSNAKSR